MKLSHLLLVSLAAALPLTACASKDKPADAPPGAEAQAAAPPKTRSGIEKFFDADLENAGPCPLMGVLYDASRKVEFTGDGERFANVAYTGEFRGVRGLCRYVGTDPIEMQLDIDLAFGKGPAANGSRKTYRYWVAVTRANLAPIEKKYFDVTVEFPRGQDVVTRSETIDRIIIPRANNGVSGANFEILVGFDLTESQLEFNRAGKRFRVDAGNKS
jgi:hypothetical protein